MEWIAIILMMAGQTAWFSYYIKKQVPGIVRQQLQQLKAELIVEQDQQLNINNRALYQAFRRIIQEEFANIQKKNKENFASQ